MEENRGASVCLGCCPQPFSPPLAPGPLSGRGLTPGSPPRPRPFLPHTPQVSAVQSWAQDSLPSPNEVTLFRHETPSGAAQLLMARGLLTGAASPSVSHPAGAPVEPGELCRAWGSLPAGLALPSRGWLPHGLPFSASSFLKCCLLFSKQACFFFSLFGVSGNYFAFLNCLSAL